MGCNGISSNAGYIRGGVWRQINTHVISANFVDSNAVFASTVPTPATIVQTVNQDPVIVGLSSPTVTATAPVYGQTTQILATVTPFLVPNVAAGDQAIEFLQQIRIDGNANAAKLAHLYASVAGAGRIKLAVARFE